MKAARLALALALASLTACATGWTHLPNKEKRIASGLYVTPQIEWSRYSSGKSEVWTVHGMGLESLWIAKGIPDGKPLDPPVSSHEKMPLFRSAMTASEIAELVVETYRRRGGGKVELLGVRPASLAGRPGFRMDLAITAASGLEYAGFAAGAVVDEKLFLLLFDAPTLHYFDAYAPTVERVIASVRFE